MNKLTVFLKPEGEREFVEQPPRNRRRFAHSVCSAGALTVYQLEDMGVFAPPMRRCLAVFAPGTWQTLEYSEAVRLSNEETARMLMGTD